jgi:hypothetical protein
MPHHCLGHFCCNAFLQQGMVHSIIGPSMDTVMCGSLAYQRIIMVKMKPWLYISTL